MVIILGQQYNIGEKPTVILYTYINRHAGTPAKQRRQNSTSSNIIIYCYIGYKNDFPTTLNREQRGPPCRLSLVVTLGQQYNIGEKPTVILYTYINRHAGTPAKQRRQNSTSSNIIIYCYIGYKNDFPTTLNREQRGPPCRLSS